MPNADDTHDRCVACGGETILIAYGYPGPRCSRRPSAARSSSAAAPSFTVSRPVAAAAAEPSPTRDRHSD